MLPTGLSDQNQEHPSTTGRRGQTPGDRPCDGGSNPGGPPVRISICLCTFKRPVLLAELLRTLLRQETDGLFTFSIVVVDNDREGSARQTVDQFRLEHPDIIAYFIEPEQNIAAARNRTVAVASGELVCFIDDDEVATSG